MNTLCLAIKKKLRTFQNILLQQQYLNKLNVYKLKNTLSNILTQVLKACNNHIAKAGFWKQADIFMDMITFFIALILFVYGNDSIFH